MESAAKRECAAWRARDGGRTQVVFSVWDLYEMVRVQLFERDPRTLAVRLLGQLVRIPPHHREVPTRPPAASRGERERESERRGGEERKRAIARRGQRQRQGQTEGEKVMACVCGWVCRADDAFW